MDDQACLAEQADDAGNGMKLGISAFAWTAAFGTAHVSLLASVRAFGFDALEIPMFVPGDLPVAALRRAFEANHLTCTVCAILPADINPISPDAATRRRALTHLRTCIETAAELGATLVGGPVFAPIGYLPPHRPTQDEWSWAVECFQSLGDLLDANGITLAIEPVNRSETFFLRTAAEARALCEAIGHPRVGVTLDTFHANIEEKSVPGAILALGSHLRHMHLSENDRSLLGTGHVDVPAILKALRGIAYDGMLMIEGFGYSPSEFHAPGTLWADQTVSPEALATNGLAYLQRLLTKRPANA